MCQADLASFLSTTNHRLRSPFSNLLPLETPSNSNHFQLLPRTSHPTRISAAVQISSAPLCSKLDFGILFRFPSCDHGNFIIRHSGSKFAKCHDPDAHRAQPSRASAAPDRDSRRAGTGPVTVTRSGSRNEQCFSVAAGLGNLVVRLVDSDHYCRYTEPISKIITVVT